MDAPGLALSNSCSQTVKLFQLNFKWLCSSGVCQGFSEAEPGAGAPRSPGFRVSAPHLVLEIVRLFMRPSASGSGLSVPVRTVFMLLVQEPISAVTHH